MTLNYTTNEIINWDSFSYQKIVLRKYEIVGVQCNYLEMLSGTD